MIMAPKNTYNFHERKAGFCQAYADAGLCADEELLFGFDDEKSWWLVAKEKMIGYLQAHPDVTALVLPGYRLTIAGIHAIHRVGRRIGEDIALIGHDCDMINDALNPPITYVRLPVDEIAVNAIELLIDAIKTKGERPPRVIRVSAQKIEGESVFQI